MDNKILELLNQINNKVDNLSNEIKEVKNEMKEVKNEIKEVKVNVKEIDKKLDGVVEQTADLTEFRTETRESLEKVTADTKFIKHKLSETEQDVFNIKDHLKIIK